MNLKVIDAEFSVCKVEDHTQIDLNEEFVFTGHTDEELSLVCPTTLVPDNTTERNDGWKGRITLSASLLSQRSTPTIY